MKKILLIAFALFFLTFPVQAAGILGGNMAAVPSTGVVYSGSIAIRVGGETGAAMVDGLPSAITSLSNLTNGNYRIDITDSGAHVLSGFLKSIGTSEGLGSDIPAGGASFDNAGYWALSTGWVVAGGNLTVTAVSAGAAIANNTTVNTQYQLLKFTYISTSCTGGFTARIAGESVGPVHTSAGTYTDYLTKTTAADQGVGLRYGSGTLSAVFSDCSIWPVTAPSTSGVESCQHKAEQHITGLQA